ncbi:MAG: ATP-dependent 6-phosphofructokinase [Planctomycetota bacterium]|jgi:6-phosphofructokinase 1|nr:ATP-dependent 6-phosphofructokinase [Planctomycetota bacterium]
MALAAITRLGPCTYPAPARQFVSDADRIPADAVWVNGVPPDDPLLFEHAGARPALFFKPGTGRAAIVTCGGLCPGLNNVIRSLYLELHHGYGISEVLGFRHGYGGLDPDAELKPIALDLDEVDDIHRDGGTILGTSRGPVDIARAVNNLIAQGISMLFCVGGDGTQRGAFEIYEEAKRRGHPLAVVGVPKTIDNDITFVDRTFGFVTAVNEARDVIDCAHTECHSVDMGVSLVRLMGRHAGFIAAAATLASQDVNLCLIPEVPFTLDGPNGILAYLEQRLRRRRHAVVVVAEGAGQHCFDSAQGSDKSGNAKLHDIGEFLDQKIRAWAADIKLPITMRYFDPGYQIRSSAANTVDAVLCDRFARHAVHAAMSGRTGLIIGSVNGHFVHVPTALLKQHPRTLAPDADIWQGVLASTGQPATWS